MESKKFNILIVDDEPKNITLVASFLGIMKNYNLSYTTDPAKALEMVREKKYDLLLLDINMPKIDGFEVCKTIKNNPETKGIPIIFLTAMLDDGSMKEAFRAGAADYITKPIKKIELVSRVKTIFLLHAHETEIKQLEIRNKFLQFVNKTSIDAQTNPIIYHDKEKMFFCNKALLLLLGYESVTDFLENKKSVLDIIYDNNCKASELNDIEWLEYINDNKDEKHRVSIQSKDGLKHFLINISRLHLDKYLQYIIFFEEIDKPKFTFGESRER